jgi:hypothetical protein
VLIYPFVAYLAGKQVFNPARIDLYKDGLDIKSIGFFPWNRLVIIWAEKMLHIGIVMDQDEFEKTKRPSGAEQCNYNPTLKIMVMAFRTSYLWQTVSLKKFYEAQLPYAPLQKTGAPVSQPTANTSAKDTAVWRRGDAESINTPWKGWWMTALVIPGVYYMMLGPAFIPSADWYRTGTMIVAALSLWFLTWLAIKKIKGTLRIQKKYTGIQRILIVLTLCFIVPLILMSSIVYGPGAVLTMINGKPYTSAVFIPDRSRATMDDGAYKMQSPHLKKLMLKDFKIDKESYDRLPPFGIIVVYGDQSWFGRTLKRYTVPDKTSPLHGEAKNRMADLDRDWALENRHDK